jgi:hypothetical protein
MPIDPERLENFNLMLDEWLALRAEGPDDDDDEIEDDEDTEFGQDDPLEYGETIRTRQTPVAEPPEELQDSLRR